jgi:hypothetical protein
MNPLKAIVVGMVLGAAGCAAGPNYRTPKPDTPPHFVANASGQSAAAVDLAVWWKSLNDPELDSLVERAVKSNLDLEIALTRLQQARTYESVVVGHALPEVDASAAAARGTGSDLTRGRADTPLSRLGGCPPVRTNRSRERDRGSAQPGIGGQPGAVRRAVVDVVCGAAARHLWRAEDRVRRLAAVLLSTHQAARGDGSP